MDFFVTFLSKVQEGTSSLFVDHGSTFVPVIVVCGAAMLVYHFINMFRNAEKSGRLKTMIILGSGGHTKEILNFVPSMGETFSPRIYLSTHSDRLSLEKASELESRQVSTSPPKFLSVYRIREVGQSWLSVIFGSGPIAILQSAFVLLRESPDLIICNGPGVCVPICLLNVIFRLLRIMKTKIIFIESICRVESLSMTGKIMIYLADFVFVQWEELQRICSAKYPKVQIRYMGRLT